MRTVAFCEIEEACRNHLAERTGLECPSTATCDLRRLDSSQPGCSKTSWPPKSTSQLTLFAEASPAKTSAKPGSASGSTAHEADCGAKCCGWCKSCDPVGWSLRTSLLSSIEAMTGLRPTWKRQVTPAGRSWWALSTSEHRKAAAAHGLWQTPTTRDYKGQSRAREPERRGKNGKLHVANLCDQLVDIGRPDLVRSYTFREWMMGLPIGFTASVRSATPSSRKSRKSSGEQS
jgi:hypothetical protein